VIRLVTSALSVVTAATSWVLRLVSVVLLLAAPAVLFVVSGDVVAEDELSPEFGLVDEFELPAVLLRSPERLPVAEAVVPVMELAPGLVVEELARGEYTDELDEGVEEVCAVVEVALEGP